LNNFKKRSEIEKEMKPLESTSAKRREKKEKEKRRNGEIKQRNR